MYQGWTITRWETPVADIWDLALVSLSDDNDHLDIVVQSLRDSERRRWRARFSRRFAAYRVTSESLLSTLWRWMEEAGAQGVRTFMFEESDWHVAYAWNPTHTPPWVHYVISTLDDCVEVYADEAPVWEELDPAGPTDPPPGKATHLFLPDDNEEVETLVDEIVARQKPYIRRARIEKFRSLVKRPFRGGDPG